MSTVEKLEADEAAADRAFDDMTPEEVRARWGMDSGASTVVVNLPRPGLPPKYYATVHGVETLAALKALAKKLEVVGYPIALENVVADAFAAIAKAEGRAP